MQPLSHASEWLAQGFETLLVSHQLYKAARKRVPQLHGVWRGFSAQHALRRTAGTDTQETQTT